MQLPGCSVRCGSVREWGGCLEVRWLSVGQADGGAAIWWTFRFRHRFEYSMPELVEVLRYVLWTCVDVHSREAGKNKQTNRVSKKEVKLCTG